MTSTDDRAARLEEAIRLKRAAARAGGSALPRRPPAEAAELGELQRSLWLLHRMEPSSPAYNLCAAFRVDGELGPGELERAASQVVARHRILRSTFRLEGDVVRQVIGPPEPLPLEVVRAPDGGVLGAAVEEARRPFDLEVGPLVRLRLVEDAAGRERLLLLVLHHILADERSLGFIWRELAAAYRGRLPAGPPPAQYDDWVHWSAGRDAEARRRDLDEWRRRLDPPPEELRLPFETPAGAGGAPRGKLLARRAANGVGPGVRRLAATAGVSPFMVYAGAFRLLLERYTGGQRIAFATPASQRSHPATAEMIGYFLNPVVVAGRVDEDLPVAAALGRYGGQLKEDLGRASVPFQLLVEELAPPRQPDRHPLFQSMFVHQEAPPPPELGGARLEPVTLDLGESKFDLTLFVTEGNEAVDLAVEYRADRFEPGCMERLLGHYETLLEQLPEDLDRPVAEVPMLPRAELDELRRAAHGAAPTGPGIALLPRRILDQACQSPDGPAVACGGSSVSYGGLVGAASAVAAALRAGGVGAGERVGLFVDRSPEMISSLLGCHLAGAAYVPLDPRYPADRNRLVLEDAEAAAVLTTSRLSGRLPRGSWRVVEVDRIEASDAPAATRVDLSPDSVAYLLYTSGSTGRPKGVVVTHDNLRASTAARFTVYGERPKRFLLVPSVAFDSSVAGIFWALAAGGALVVPTDEEVADPRHLARLVAQERVTGLLCVPSLWDQMLAAGGDALQGLEIAIVAGESCPPGLVEEHFRVLPGVRLFNEYGPTEGTVWATVQELTEKHAAGPVPIGRPIPGVRLEVLDGRGRPVPAGVPGEAWIAGPTVARGYWRRPELTRERFPDPDPGAPDRRYRTGDRMAWTPDGRLLFLGRDDEQIKLRGFRIEPGEVEAALLELPGVERAAVVARSLAEGAAAGGAASHLVAFAQGQPTTASWRRELAERLPEAMLPSRLVEMPELPRLPNGKLDRRRLREMRLAPEEPAGKQGPPPGNLEQALISLWQGLLGVSGIGVDDNFFELGGHSLLVVELALAIERELEVGLPVADLFANPTVRQLARLVEQRGGSRAPAYEHLVPIQPRGSGRPFVIALPHFFTEMLANRFRAERPVYGLRGVGLRPEGNLGRWRSMRQLGEDLVAEIERRFEGRPCILAGYSFGASMAFEAARLMERRGLPVERLYLIAPMPLDHLRLGPFRVQLDGLRKPVEELETGEALRLWARGNNPFSRRPWARAKRRLLVEPWRRLLCLAGRLRRRMGLPLTESMLYADVRVDRFRLHARYRPGVVRTPTVFFNPREPATDAAATWRPCFAGPFTVRETPDPHLDGEAVEAARQVILEQLEELGDEA